MKNKKRNLRVCVSSNISPFRYFQLSGSAKVEEITKETEAVYLPVSNLAEASEVCQSYIREYNLGSSNWTGGRVINDDSDFVANISYNGRVWNSEDHVKAEEIAV